MGAAMLKLSKRHDWTEEQDKYLADHHAYQTIEEMGQVLGISRGRVKYRLDKLGIEKKRLNVVPEDQKTPAPDKDATPWAGGCRLSRRGTRASQAALSTKAQPRVTWRQKNEKAQTNPPR